MAVAYEEALVQDAGLQWRNGAGRSVSHTKTGGRARQTHQGSFTLAARFGLAIGIAWLVLSAHAQAQSTAAVQQSAAANSNGSQLTPALQPIVAPAVAADRQTGFVTVSKASVLVGSFTVFLLAVFVGFEIITKVPPTLHTPLMSGSNAISGITVVGAMLTAGSAVGGFGSLLGLLAVVLATVNVVGGFFVTHRMLMMFKKR